jgi:drug/metabolite transporter (DMT)-like permease
MDIRRVAAYAAIYLLWGGAYVAIRRLVEVLPPFFAAGLRYGLAALFLLPVLLLFARPAITRRQAFNGAWSGITLLVFGYSVVFWTEQRLPSWLVAVLMSTTFLWTYLGESLVLRSYRFRLRMLPLLLLGIAAMPLVAGGRGADGRAISVMPAIATLLCAMCWSCGSLAVKAIDMPHSPVQTAAIQMGVSSIILLIFSWFLGEWRRMPSLGQTAWWQPAVAMAFLVIGSSVLGFVAYHWLMAHEPASRVATSAYVNPLVAMLVGIVAMHEHNTALQLAGAAAVLASIVLIWHSQFAREPLRAVAGAES